MGNRFKHNHFAVKHSRLSNVLDFGDKWYGIPCSQQYWKDIAPIFDFLRIEKCHGKKWRDLETKNDDVYSPLLQAFQREILTQLKTNPQLPQKMVEYLLGEFDFYKVISIDAKRITQIQTYNLHGTLNQSSKTTKPSIKIPVAYLPKRIVSFDFKPNSKNTLELYMDGGWQFSFRIHNASTMVEPSLKFDIQMIGMPSAIITINSSWNR